MMRSAFTRALLVAAMASTGLQFTAAGATDATTTAVPSPVVVTLDSGQISAPADPTGIHVFRGIPYAQPPVGPLRWKPAMPVTPWTGIREATSFGPACLQRTKLTARELAATGAAPANVSEDCLTLNVWTPAKTDKPVPVMVWLHGGGHTAGSGSLAFYDGSSFARDGVILVSINYRLGLMGYFAHPALTREAGKGAPLGSYGTTDQLQALRWVQKNIAAFGGDPTNVTVFGESAGAQSTLTLLATPSAKGLFARAIAESAYISGKFPTLTEAEAVGGKVATTLGLAGADATADQLRALSGEALIAAQEKLPPGPIVDGNLLPALPAMAIADGKTLHVPLMIGTNSDEGSLISARDPASVLAEGTPDLAAFGRTYYGAGAATDTLLARKLWRDWTFTTPTRWVARKASTTQPVWLYHYDYTPVRLRKIWDGVPHGYEVPFVFDSLSRVAQFAPLLTDEDRAAISKVHSCWVSFAKTGTPACNGTPAWPAYTAASDQLMDFGTTASVKTHFDKPILDRIETGIVALGRLKP